MKKTLMLMAALLFPTLAHALTPSEVFNVVDKINAELDVLLAEEFVTDIPTSNDIELTTRAPKHVVQKAREIYTRVAELQKLNDISAAPLPAIPMVLITPADVKAVVDKVLINVVQVREHVGAEAPAYPALPSGKTPTDVYRHLELAGRKINLLGIPAIVPNDVYRAALQIIQDLETLRAHKGITGEVAEVSVSGKLPGDVYGVTYHFIEDLRNSGLPGTNDIVLPHRATGTITPSNVLDLQNQALAELHEVKVKSGIKTPASFPAVQSGKTPSNVYAAIEKARSLLETLK